MDHTQAKTVTQEKTVAQGEKNPAEAGRGLVREFLYGLDGFQEVIGKLCCEGFGIFLYITLSASLRCALPPICI
jgi:hypothetical protein